MCIYQVSIPLGYVISINLSWVKIRRFIVILLSDDNFTVSTIPVPVCRLKNDDELWTGCYISLLLV